MTTTLVVTERDQSTNLHTLRANDQVPAVVYGPAQTPIAITLDGKTFDKVRQAAGESTVIELTGLQEPVEVLIKEVSFDPVKQQVTHVDFYAVEKGKKMTARVPLNFIGESPAEASKLGSVTKVLHEVEVTCTPADLPSSIEVDLSVLKEVSDKIHVSDLIVPAGVTIELDAEEAVVVVSAATSSTTEEEEETSATVDMDAVEVEQKGKGEESSEEEG